MRPTKVIDAVAAMALYTEGFSIMYVATKFRVSYTTMRKLLIKGKAYVSGLKNDHEPEVSQFQKLYTGSTKLSLVCQKMSITRARGTALGHIAMLNHRVPGLPPPRTMKELLVHNTWRDHPDYKESWRATAQKCRIGIPYVRAYIKQQKPVKRGSK